MGRSCSSGLRFFVSMNLYLHQHQYQVGHNIYTEAERQQIFEEASLHELLSVHHGMENKLVFL